MNPHLLKVLKEIYLEFNLGHYAKQNIHTLQQLVEQRVNPILVEDLTITQFLEIVEEEK